MVAAPCASASTSPTPASPRAAPRSSSCSPGASPSAARSSAIRRATWGRATTSRSTAAWSRWSASHVVYALNKPAGYVSTAKDPQGRPTVVSLVPSRERLYPVGRLDADTTGLILLTNDGELAHRLTHPSFEVPRVYRAQVRSAPVREPALRRLREGVALDDGMTAPAGARRLTPERVELVAARGPQAPGAADARGRRPPASCGWSASPSGRCGSATSRSAATGGSRRRRWRSCGRPAAGRRRRRRRGAGRGGHPVDGLGRSAPSEVPRFRRANPRPGAPKPGPGSSATRPRSRNAAAGSSPRPSARQSSHARKLASGGR